MHKKTDEIKAYVLCIKSPSHLHDKTNVLNNTPSGPVFLLEIVIINQRDWTQTQLKGPAD